MDKIQTSQKPPQARSATGPAIDGEVHPLDDALCYMRTYARQKPEMAALWCFGVGFVLGWKLKPW